jgi:hypothetical protein
VSTNLAIGQCSRGEISTGRVSRDAIIAPLGVTPENGRAATQLMAVTLHKE